MTISPLAADIIGICGSVLFIIGFAYANLAKVMNQILFNAVNLAGAILLLTSLWVHFNLAAFVLEVAWGFIALLGLGKALWDRRKAAHLPESLEAADGRPSGVLPELPLSPSLSPNGEREK